MLSIAWKVTLGDTALESGAQGSVLLLETCAALAMPINSCHVVLGGGTKLSVKPGDPVKVELGYKSDRSLVFTGKAAVVKRGLGQHNIEALSSFAGLTNGHINSLYEKQYAGDIATDLLTKMDVEKSGIEDGQKFASFAVSQRFSVSETLHRLAECCGFDFYADAEDKAVFKKYSASTTHSFSYGTDILRFESRAVGPSVDGVEVYGESPAGQGQGADASSWLTKKPVKGSAGKSFGRVERVADPAARTESAARAIAQNLFDAANEDSQGTVKVVGSPKVRLGDAIEVSTMDDASLNGLFKVTAVRHKVSARGGFITSVDWEKIA